jgi:hypothetical protein
MQILFSNTNSTFLARVDFAIGCTLANETPDAVVFESLESSICEGKISDIEPDSFFSSFHVRSREHVRLGHTAKRNRLPMPL